MASGGLFHSTTIQACIFFFEKLLKEKKCGCIVRIGSESDACEYRYYILWSVCCGLNCTCIDCTYCAEYSIKLISVSYLFYWRIYPLEAMFIATHFQDPPHLVV